MKVFVTFPIVSLVSVATGACGGDVAARNVSVRGDTQNRAPLGHQPPQTRDNGGNASSSPAGLRVIPGTMQNNCYSDRAIISCPSVGEDFFGQDATHPGTATSYRDNGDGTVSDLVTGMMWAKQPSAKISWEDALSSAQTLRLGGFSDWRLPAIKELYSLIDFRGHFGTTAQSSLPFIDLNVFTFLYGTDSTGGIGPGTRPGNRFIDVQEWSSTKYVGTTMNGDATVFGVNFADGRIKGYPQFEPGSGGSTPWKMLARYVRGPRFGENVLTATGDGVVVDSSSSLAWQQLDDGVTRDWKQALAYCEGLSLGGKDDWRLPNAKELQSIVDYSRAPAVTSSAAISPPLQVTHVESYFWSSTTLSEQPIQGAPSGSAVMIAFGRALGYAEMPPGSGMRKLVDVHGAGAQRADFKSGSPSSFPQGYGPQGDDARIKNYVRCVRTNR